MIIYNTIVAHGIAIKKKCVYSLLSYRSCTVQHAVFYNSQKNVKVIKYCSVNNNEIFQRFKHCHYYATLL